LKPNAFSSELAPGSPVENAPNARDVPRKVQSVLFMCAMNAVRSPMAEALAKHFFGKSIYVQSAGARKGEIDGFVSTVLDEIGIDLSRHKPKSIEELEEWEGLNFDLIITLSPEAHHKALHLTRTHSAEV
jgi:protein-tyrosine-phosphatase